MNEGQGVRIQKRVSVRVGRSYTATKAIRERSWNGKSLGATKSQDGKEENDDDMVVGRRERHSLDGDGNKRPGKEARTVTGT